MWVEEEREVRKKSMVHVYCLSFIVHAYYLEKFVVAVVVILFILVECSAFTVVVACRWLCMCILEVSSGGIRLSVEIVFETGSVCMYVCHVYVFVSICLNIYIRIYVCM